MHSLAPVGLSFLMLRWKVCQQPKGTTEATLVWNVSTTVTEYHHWIYMVHFHILSLDLTVAI